MFSQLYLSLECLGPPRKPFLVITAWLTSVVGSAVVVKMSKRFSKILKAPKREGDFCCQLKTMREKQF